MDVPTLQGIPWALKPSARSRWSIERALSHAHPYDLLPVHDHVLRRSFLAEHTAHSSDEE